MVRAPFDGVVAAKLLDVGAAASPATPVFNLVAKGIEVHLVVDAIGSRDPANKDVAVQRARAEGATLTTVEMALLELCERAGTEEFKQVQELIK